MTRYMKFRMTPPRDVNDKGINLMETPGWRCPLILFQNFQVTLNDLWLLYATS